MPVPPLTSFPTPPGYTNQRVCAEAYHVATRLRVLLQLIPVNNREAGAAVDSTAASAIASVTSLIADLEAGATSGRLDG